MHVQEKTYVPSVPEFPERQPSPQRKNQTSMGPALVNPHPLQKAQRMGHPPNRSTSVPPSTRPLAVSGAIQRIFTLE